MILDRKEKPRYLFNISKDPYEMYNMLSQETEQARLLFDQFLKFKDSIDTDAIKAARSN